MKFMLLMQGSQSGWESFCGLQPPEIRAHIEFMKGLVAGLAASGELVLAEGLDMPSNARIVRAERPDRPVVSEGPFAETKEFLAGFWIVEVASQQRALQIAAKASTAPGRGGQPMQIPIEVRQVMSAPEL